MSRRRSGSSRPASRPPATGGSTPARPLRRTIAAAAGLFALSLAARLFFANATPDARWAYSATLKGDAPLWLEYAHALHAGQPFELGLPIHPPGAAYLAAALWDGRTESLLPLRMAWAVIGALTVVALWTAARRAFGPVAAWLSAAWAACSTGLIVLSNSVGAEAPYLLLAVASLGLVEEVRVRPRPWLLAGWGALNAAACLFRVEHVLAFAFVSGWLFWKTLRSGAIARGGVAARVAALLAGFALPLGPWHLHAWRAIARLNAEPVVSALPAGVEQDTRAAAWEPDALRLKEELPAFARGTAAAFVAATVFHRGGDRVRPADFEILDQAFGYVPRPLARFPFVSNYGPLNFALANHPAADGGFSRAALEAPPPLAGGPGRYPPELIRGLPPPDLALVYPPHLRLFNEGYAAGWAWISSRPGRFLRLSLRKLRIFWSGAALGQTGFNLPLGLSGPRRAVDMLVPDPGYLERAWLGTLALACAAGAAIGRARPALAPWLLYLASKLVATVLFFGYARQGALVIPVVALLMGLAAERLIGGRRPERRRALVALAAAALLAGVAIEASRYWRPPRLTIDGRAIEGGDPFPTGIHRDQRVELN